ncbi:gamma-aminobutyric acid receptor subunit gamma-3-like [Galendromus occidentalis]|uniref:Gamma-aminobutyric acid receptor subunit gamma-3-like n=1 Tax=Galendromus occidentalis TaxID=34638 RepID=A0AAJ6QYY5_9ACAR|nr:gamma-aminobutyric acid receptor subunit gamma-3-like [Galendromus occidentalis]
MSFLSAPVIFAALYGSSDCENPMHYTKPLPVDVSIFVITLGEPDLLQMEFTLDLIALSSWSADIRVCEDVNKTSRIHDNVGNILGYYEDLWLPGLTFRQAASTRMPSKTNPPFGVELQVLPEEDVCRFTEKRRVSIVVRCDMDLHWFPLDVQYCPVDFHSFTYPARLLTVAWGTNLNKNYLPSDRAFRVNPHIQSLQYDVVYTADRNNNLPWYWNLLTPEEPDDGVRFTVIFHRRFTYQFITTYVPCTAVTIAALSALFISVEMTVERINLAAITLVSLYSQIARYRASLPSTPFLTVCDVYLYASLISVVSTILVCALVKRFHKEDLKLEKYLRERTMARAKHSPRSLRRRRRRNSYLIEDLRRTPSLTDADVALEGLLSRSSSCLSLSQNLQRNERFNKHCRRLMISLYMIFLAVYFMYIFAYGPK